MAERYERWIGAAALVAGALGLYALLIEPTRLETTRTRIHLRHLPAALEGLRIALLTDLHVGEGTPLSLVRRACEHTMRENPDLIALTGDFAADSAPSFRPVLDALSGLRAPLGVYAVPGNHDYRVGIERWHREVGAYPTITDLTNQAVVQEVGGARVCVAGVDDFSKGRPRLADLPPPERRDLTILLAHDPLQAERTRRSRDRVDLILSGHTHGGQIRVPGIGRIAKPKNYRRVPYSIEKQYDEGLRRQPWTQVYTSRGLGTVGLPLRFLAPPEVAILELTSAPRPKW